MEICFHSVRSNSALEHSWFTPVSRAWPWRAKGEQQEERCTDTFFRLVCGVFKTLFEFYSSLGIIWSWHRPDRWFHGLMLGYEQCAFLYFWLNASRNSSWRYRTRNPLAILRGHKLLCWRCAQPTMPLIPTPGCGPWPRALDRNRGCC